MSKTQTSTFTENQQASPIGSLDDALKLSILVTDTATTFQNSNPDSQDFETKDWRSDYETYSKQTDIQKRKLDETPLPLDTCGTSFYPISFEGTCTLNCQIEGQGVLFLSTGYIAAYGSMNYGNEYFQDNTKTKKDGIIYVFNQIAWVYWAQQLRISRLLDDTVATVYEDSVSKDILVYVQSIDLTDHQLNKNALVVLSSEGLFKKSAYISFSQDTFVKHLSGISFMTYFQGGSTVTLLGRYMYNDAGTIHEAFGDLFLNYDSGSLTFTASGAFLLPTLDQITTEGTGTGLAYASDLIVYNIVNMAQLSLKHFIEGTQLHILADFYQQNEGYMLAWHQDLTIDFTGVNPSIQSKAVVTKNDEFAIFYTIDSISINVVYLQTSTGSAGSSDQKSFKLSWGSEIDQVIQGFNVESINYGGYEQSGSFVIMTKISHDDSGFVVLVIDQATFAIQNHKVVGQSQAVGYGGKFMSYSSSQKAAYFYQNVQTFASLTSPDGTPITMITGRIELPTSANNIKDLGEFDCTSINSLITIEIAEVFSLTITSPVAGFSIDLTIGSSIIEEPIGFDNYELISALSTPQLEYTFPVKMIDSLSNTYNKKSCQGGKPISLASRVTGSTYDLLDNSVTYDLIASSQENQCQNYQIDLTYNIDQSALQSAGYNNEASCVGLISEGKIAAYQQSITCEIVPSYRQIFVDQCLIYEGEVSDDCIVSVVGFQIERDPEQPIDLINQCTQQSEKTFPKVLGKEGQDFIVYGSHFIESLIGEIPDIKPDLSILMCGSTSKDMYPLKQYSSLTLTEAAYILKTNINGMISWMHSGRDILSTKSAFIQCSSMGNEDNLVFGLLRQINAFFQALTIVKFDYDTGRVQQAFLIPGYVQASTRIFETSTSLFIYGTSTEINQGDFSVSQFTRTQEKMRLQKRLYGVRDPSLTDSNQFTDAAAISDKIYFVGPLDLASVQYVHIAEVNAITGDILQTMNILTGQPQQTSSIKTEFSITTATPNLIISAFTIGENTFTKSLIIIDLDNSANNKVHIFDIEDQTVDYTRSDVSINGNYIVDALLQGDTVGDNSWYIITIYEKTEGVYTRTALKLMNKAQFTKSEMISIYITNLAQSPPAIFLAYSSNNYLPKFTVTEEPLVQKSFISGVINMFDITGSTENSCAQLIDLLELGQFTVYENEITIVALTDIVYNYDFDNYILEEKSGLYFEQKYQNEDVQFVKASSSEFNCLNDVSYNFIKDLGVKTLTSGAASQTIEIVVPVICKLPDTITITVSVDQEGETPYSWYSHTVVGNLLTITLEDTTDDNVGIYTMRIKYEISGSSIDQFLVIVISKAAEYNLVDSSSCEENQLKEYQIFQSTTTDYSVLQADYNQDHTNYIICGENNGVNVNGWPQSSVYYQLFTESDMLIYHKSVKSISDNTLSEQFNLCEIDQLDDIWLAFNSEYSIGSSRQNLVKYSIGGTYILGKQFVIQEGGNIQITNIEVNGNDITVLANEVVALINYPTIIKLTQTESLGFADIQLVSVHQFKSMPQIPQRLRNLQADEVNYHSLNMRNLATTPYDDIKFLNHYIDVTNKHIYSLGLRQDDYAFTFLASINYDSMTVNWAQLLDGQFSLIPEDYHSINSDDDHLFTCMVGNTQSDRRILLSQYGTVVPPEEGRRRLVGEPIYIEGSLMHTTAFTIQEDTIKSCQVSVNSQEPEPRLIVSLAASEQVSIYVFSRSDTAFTKLSTTSYLQIMNQKTADNQQQSTAIVNRFFLNSINNYYTIFTHNEITSGGDTLQGLFKTRFSLDLSTNIIEWSTNKCSLLQQSVAIPENTELWMSSVEDSDTLINSSWIDFSNFVALKEINLASIESQFTQPTNLAELTLDMTIVNYKDFRYNYEHETTQCRSIIDPELVENQDIDTTFSNDYEPVAAEQTYNVFFQQYKYSQCQGFKVSYQATVTKTVGETTSTVDSGSYTYLDEVESNNFVEFQLTIDNGDASYAIKEIAYLTQFEEVTASSDFTLALTGNDPPTININADYELIASFEYTQTDSLYWQFTIDDTEDDEITVNVVVYDSEEVELSVSWAQISTISSDIKMLTVANIELVEAPTSEQVFTIKVSVTDASNPEATAAAQIKEITLTVVPYNNRPKLVDAATANIFTVNAGKLTSFFVLDSFFADDDEDDILSIDCSIELPSWMQTTPFDGLGWLMIVNSPLGTAEGDYTFTCQASDSKDDMNIDFTVTISSGNVSPSFTVNPAGIIESWTVLVDAENIEIPAEAKCYDVDLEDSLTITYTDLADDSAISELTTPLFLASDKLTASNIDDDLAKTYSILLKCTDLTHQPVYNFLKVDLPRNSKPQLVESPETIEIQIFYQEIEISSSISGLFTDEDTLQTLDLFKIYISTSNQDKSLVPSFLAYKDELTYAVPTALGAFTLDLSIASSDDIITHSLFVFVEDPRGAVNLDPGSLSLEIIGCDVSCKTCSGPDYDNCDTCIDNGEFVYIKSEQNECLIQCGENKYKLASTQCGDCGGFCKVCTGTGNTLDESNCQECRDDAVDYYDECIEQCPSTHYNSDGVCQEIVTPVLKLGEEFFTETIEVQQGDEPSQYIYTLENPQSGVEVVYSYTVYAGQGEEITEESIDISQTLTWISLMPNLQGDDVKLAFGDQNAIPNTEGQDVVYTIKLKLAIGATLKSEYNIVVTLLYVNSPPIVETDVESEISMNYDDSALIWQFTATNDLDVLADEVTFHTVITDFEGTTISSPSWLSKTTSEGGDLLTITISGFELFSGQQVFTIKVYVTDKANLDAEGASSQTITLTVTGDTFPYIKNVDTKNIYVGKLTGEGVFLIPTIFFADPLNAPITINCDLEGKLAWINVNHFSYGELITVSEFTEADVSIGSVYDLTCEVQGSQTITETFHIEISETNASPQVYINPQTNTMYAWTVQVDYLNQATPTLDKYTTAKFYIGADGYLWANNDKDENAGSYNIFMSCSDSIEGHMPIYNVIPLVIQANSPPRSQEGLSFQMNQFYASTNIIIGANYFTDPNSQHNYISQFKFYVSTSSTDKSQTPSLMSYKDSLTYAITDQDNKITLNFQGVLGDVGTKNYYLIAEDPRGAIAYVGMILDIKGCDGSCLTCFGYNFYECSSCNTVLYDFIENSETSKLCKIKCNSNQYQSTTTSCANCPEVCETCTGASPTTNNCVCKSTAFTYDGYCLASCPQSTYHNENSQTCQNVIPPQFSSSNGGYATTITAMKDIVTADAVYQLANPQYSITVAFSYTIYEGQDGTNYPKQSTDISGSMTWITKVDDGNSFSLKFGSESFPIPDTAEAGVYQYYTITLKMLNSAGQSTLRNVPLTLKTNAPPTLKAGVSVVLSELRPGQTFTTISLVKSDLFEDVDGDSFTMTCSLSAKPETAPTQWLTLTPSGDNYDLSGTLTKSNLYTADYEVNFVVTDTVNNLSKTYSLVVRVIENNIPVVNTEAVPATQTIQITESYSKLLDLFCTDSNNFDTVSYSVKVDGNALSTTAYKGFTYTSASNTIAFDYQNVANSGQHNVEVTCTDGILQNIVSTTFKVIAVGVDPILKGDPLSDIQLQMNQVGSKLIELVNPEYQTTVTFSYQIYAWSGQTPNTNTDISAQKPWITSTTDSQAKTFLILWGATTSVPDISINEKYTVRVKIENQDGATDQIDQIINLVVNNAPQITSQSNLILTSGKVGKSLTSQTILKSYFTDDQTFTLACTKSNATATWLLLADEGTEFTITGDIPKDNVWAATDYEIKCTLTDSLQKAQDYKFVLAVDSNAAPAVASTPGTVNVAKNTTYTQSLDGLCSDADGDALTYSFKVNGTTTDGQSDFQYDTQTSTFTFDFQSNANFGENTITVYCTDGVGTRTTSLSYLIVGTFVAPLWQTGYQSSVTVKKNQQSDISFTINNEQDLIDFQIVYHVYAGSGPTVGTTDLKSSKTWISVPSSTTSAQKIQLGVNAVIPEVAVAETPEIYTVELIVQISATVFDKATLVVTLDTNIAPKILNVASQTLPSFVVGRPVSTIIQKSYFQDTEDFSLTCTVKTVGATWITLTPSSGNVVISGTTPSPFSNTDAKDYIIGCDVTDTTSSTRSYDFTMTITANSAPTISSTPTDESVAYKDTYTQSFANVCSDQDALTYQVKVGSTVIDSSSNGNFLFNSGTSVFTFNFLSNSNVGEHIITIICSDGISGNVVQTTFKLTAFTIAPVLQVGYLTSQTVSFGQQKILAYQVSNSAVQPGLTFSYNVYSGWNPILTNNDLQAETTWISKSEGPSTLEIQLGFAANIPAVSENVQYTVRLTIANANNQQIVVDLQLQNEANSAPMITSNDLLNLGSVKVGNQGQTLILHSYFEDYETFTLSCVKTTSTPYTTITSTGSDYEILFNFPKDNDHVGDYIFTCTVTDTYLASNDYAFILKILANQAPTFAVNPEDTSVEKYQSFSLNLVDLCSDLESDTITYQVKVNGDVINENTVNSDFSFNPSTNQFAFDFQNNQNFGSNTVEIQCSDDVSGNTNQDQFNLIGTTISPKYAVDAQTSITVRQSQQAQITYNVANPLDQITVTFNYAVYAGAVAQGTLNTNTDIKASKNWILLESGTMNFNVKFGYNNFNVPAVSIPETPEYYTIRVSMTNQDSQTNNLDLVLKLEANYAPQIISTSSQTLATNTVGVAISATIQKAFFSDQNGDTFALSCTVTTTSVPWLTLTAQQNGDYVVSGTSPKTNTYVKSDYTFTCVVTDSPYGASKSYPFYLPLIANSAPTIDVVPTQTNVYKNQVYTKAFTSVCKDVDADTLSYTMKIDGVSLTTTAYQTDFTYNAATSTFTFDFQTTSNSGNHEIQIFCTDGVDTRTVSTSYTIVAIPNQPVQILKEIEPIQIDMFTPTYSITLSEYFSDPEGLPITYELYSDQGGNYPGVITSFSNGEFEFTFMQLFTGVQTLQLMISAYDDQNQRTNLLFEIDVQGCSEGCESCTSTTSNSCTSCLDPYFLDIDSCETSCPDGTWEDSENNLCVECANGCETCTGPDEETQCSSCVDDYFLNNGGCFDRCPSGFWGNREVNECQLIDPATTTNYAECIMFLASMSDYVTDSSVLPFSKMTGKDVTCPEVYNCKGTYSLEPQSCTWRRKFAMQCTRTQNGYAALRVATNSWPDHCFDTSSYFPPEGLIDYEVAFNKQNQLTKTWVNSTAWANEYRCLNVWLKDANMNKDLSYIGYAYDNRNLRELVVGVAFNGVPIMSGLSEYGLDPFYPKKYVNLFNVRSIPVDDCLGYSALSGFYHYYSMSPCILTSTFKTTQVTGELCSNKANCLYDIVGYLAKTDVLPKPPTGIIQKVGIARDGHYIIGPYNVTNGKPWQPCEVDACNGVFISGKYYYATTLFHPYTVACWGPGSANIFAQQCSTNAKVCSGSSNNGGNPGTGSSDSYTLMFNIINVSIISLIALFITQM
eukprot:403334227